MIVLLVEDNKQQADLIKKILEQETYTVDVSYDGDEAWEKLQIRDYDLIISDLNLPGLSGEELVKKIREYNLITPLLILTANDAPVSKVVNLDQGADDYLTKPFSVDEFLARIRAVMRRPKQMLPQVFTNAGMEVVYGTREVKIHGSPIKLTRNEFRVFDYLVRRPDRVCTRAMIQEHVWGYEKELKSNVIEAVVYSLRKKIGESNKHLIETVQDIGYRFKPGT